MARYIDAKIAYAQMRALYEHYIEMRNFSADGAVSDCLKILDDTPTADVVPKSEVDTWYQLYHSIKEELKLEKMYHRETENLCDRYCIERQQAKKQVAREIFEEIEEEINAALKNNYARRSECNAETDLSHAANISGKIACLRGLADFVEELKKKYTEGKDEQAPTRDPI